MSESSERWTLGEFELQSRLLLGTARYPDRKILLDALRASGTELVTVALRRVSVDRFNPSADVQADLTALPFPDHRFDVVLSSHVLEHIRDDEAAIAELARVLRPGGWAAIMVPYDPKLPVTEEGRDVESPAERLARFGHPYHYRNYGADFTSRLAAAGFRVSVLSSRRLLTAHQRRRYRINRNHLFFCRRA